MDAVLGWNLVLSLPVILAIAWPAGRLLGVSRSLPGTVLAGVAGWLAALALSLAIASGDTGAPRVHPQPVGVRGRVHHVDPEPIAAASIAQAYRGRLRSGEAVVVKVQRPGIAESVDRDLLVLAELARVAETRTAWGPTTT